MTSRVVRSATALVCGVSLGLGGVVALPVVVGGVPVALAAAHCTSAQCVFTDVTDKTPHVDDISWLSQSRITTGYKNANGTYRFEGMTSVYRQDMAAFLRRLAQNRGIGDADTWTPSASDWARFTDVDEQTPHAEDILWLASTGITTGYRNANGTYRFEGMTKVYRQDMAAFLHRFADLDGGAVILDEVPAFTDINQVAHREDVQWLASAGVTTGYKNTNGTYRFEGMTKVYRQDMAAFLHRLDTSLDELDGWTISAAQREVTARQEEADNAAAAAAKAQETLDAVTASVKDIEAQFTAAGKDLEAAKKAAVGGWDEWYLFDDGYEVKGRAPTRDELKTHHGYSNVTEYYNDITPTQQLAIDNAQAALDALKPQHDAAQAKVAAAQQALKDANAQVNRTKTALAQAQRRLEALQRQS